MVAGLSAQEVIARLALERHPEGGWYRQTFVDASAQDRRPYSTAIYYLLEGADRSAWHRVDATEIWHWYAGAPLRLRLSTDGSTVEDVALGNDLTAGQRPQAVVPAGCWQSASSLGDWSLCGCTVAPGFRFSGFELAPAGWEPGGD